MQRFMNPKKGFTLAELMIAMLIFGVVAVAAVPFAVGNKVKKNEVHVPHGIYECFLMNLTPKCFF